MHEVTQDMQKAGLDAFMTWREAPHGIGFGDVVIAVYSAMEKARVGKEPEPTKYWTGTSDEANGVIASPAMSKLLDDECGIVRSPVRKKPTPKAHAKAPAKKA